MSDSDIQQVVQAAGKVKWIARPVWALIVSAIGFAFWFGQFQAEYRRNAEQGSPALQRLVDEQRKWNEQQLINNAQLKQIVADQERRIGRLEDQK